MSVFDNILVATDFSQTSRDAVQQAVEIAASLGSALTILHVWEVPAYAYGDALSAEDLLTPFRDRAGARLEAELDEVRAKVPKVTGLLKTGMTVDEILDAVRETGCDIVILGTHGRRGISRALLGSVAENVVRASPVPVMTIRGSVAAA